MELVELKDILSLEGVYEVNGCILDIRVEQIEKETKEYEKEVLS